MNRPYTRVERDEKDRITGIAITSSGRVKRGVAAPPTGWKASDGETDRNAGEDITRNKLH